jgi:hypothetical protein
MQQGNARKAFAGLRLPGFLGRTMLQKIKVR